MPVPILKWKPKAMTFEEHEEYFNLIKEAVKDLDYAMRCYYLSMSDDRSLTEKEKLNILKDAFEDGLREVDVTKKMKVIINGS